MFIVLILLIVSLVSHINEIKAQIRQQFFGLFVTEYCAGVKYLKISRDDCRMRNQLNTVGPADGQ